jgi:hypothetical protein
MNSDTTGRRTLWIVVLSTVAVTLIVAAGLLASCTKRDGGDWIGIGGDGPCSPTDDDDTDDDDDDTDDDDDDDSSPDDMDGDGFSPADGDCDDTDEDVFPGQTLFFDSPSNSGSFDYNCDNFAEPQSIDEFDCPEVDCLLVQEGWMDGVPDCGNDARWGVDCVMDSGCTTSFDYRRMACR